jgi:hypothetical protein
MGGGRGFGAWPCERDFSEGGGMENSRAADGPVGADRGGARVKGTVAGTGRGRETDSRESTLSGPGGLAAGGATVETGL